MGTTERRKAFLGEFREREKLRRRCIRCGKPKDEPGAEMCSSCLSGSDAVVAAFEEVVESDHTVITDWRGRTLTLTPTRKLLVIAADVGVALDLPDMIRLRDLLNRLIPASEDPERVPECWRTPTADEEG